RLGDGAPVYDGYLNAAGASAAPINQCAPPLPEADPRGGVQPRDVPFVRVMTESDFQRALALRHADSDAPGNVFRLFELAGAAHSGPFAAGQPATADLTIAGFDAPAENLCREPRGDFPLGYAFNAIWQQYDELLLQKTPMVHEPLIETGANGEVLRDAMGNARGGWRLPQIDVPLAVWRGTSTPATDDDRSRRACALTGAKQPLNAAALKARYRSRAEYLRRFAAAVDQAVQARRLTPEDAQSLKRGAGDTVPVF
ncbi:MAG TPA: alpha/beta hydrolase domain-containing protein, partial [Steroidobacteraceae bacterium]|nr:alpha/beta hydrolase domain-containing protein [Steroidobacteraceae bacterium]